MKKLVDLESFLRGAGLPRPLALPVAAFLARLLALDRLNAQYEAICETLDDREHDPAFFIKALRVIGSQFEIDSESLQRIPKEGPLLVVANHPRGALDGLVLGALLAGRRADSKLLANFLLTRMEGIRDSMIAVNPFDSSHSKRDNLKGMREAIRHLESGACLGAFPAGEVSSFRFRDRAIMDSEWSSHVVHLAKKSQAKVLPIYFEGRNSIAFQILGLIHPKIRTMLLARELFKTKGEVIKLKVGELIDSERLTRFKRKSAAIDYLRLKTYALKSEPVKKERLRFPFRSSNVIKASKPLGAAQPLSSLLAEVNRIPGRQKLVEHKEFDVFHAKAEQIPAIVKEIGRLREEAFRAVGEGTGDPVDLDEYDAYYVHLFLWHRERKEIAGAYRIGLTDSIVKQFGIKGLYTSTLFKYKREFIENVGPSLELGRSFVRLKYQKKHSALSLMWRGIGEFLALNPRYRILFGPVSITDAYDSISKNLMVHFFREHKFDEGMSKMVSARNPPKNPRVLRGSSLKNIAESIVSVDSVSAIVSGFEDDKKGIPILLRHYLKLNGFLVSFNVDPAFSDVIDGLILVDVCKSPPKLLERYFGKEAYLKIAEYHFCRNPENKEA